MIPRPTLLVTVRIMGLPFQRPWTPLLESCPGLIPGRPQKHRSDLSRPTGLPLAGS